MPRPQTQQEITLCGKGGYIVTEPHPSGQGTVSKCVWPEGTSSGTAWQRSGPEPPSGPVSQPVRLWAYPCASCPDGSQAYCVDWSDGSTTGGQCAMPAQPVYRGPRPRARRRAMATANFRRRLAAQGFAVGQLERVEVLRGPQAGPGLPSPGRVPHRRRAGVPPAEPRLDAACKAHCSAVHGHESPDFVDCYVNCATQTRAVPAPAGTYVTFPTKARARAARVTRARAAAKATRAVTPGAQREHCTHVESGGNIYKVCCPEKPFGTPWGQTCGYVKVADGGTSSDHEAEGALRAYGESLGYRMVGASRGVMDCYARCGNLFSLGSQAWHDCVGPCSIER